MISFGLSCFVNMFQTSLVPECVSQTMPVKNESGDTGQTGLVWELLLAVSEDVDEERGMLLSSSQQLLPSQPRPHSLLSD